MLRRNSAFYIFKTFYALNRYYKTELMDQAASSFLTTFFLVHSNPNNLDKIHYFLLFEFDEFYEIIYGLSKLIFHL